MARKSHFPGPWPIQFQEYFPGEGHSMNILFRMLNKLTQAVGMLSFCAMCIIIFFQVIARYVFSNAFAWPEEVARFFFIICTFASINYCMEKDGHLRLMILPLYFKNCYNKLFDFLYLLFMIIYQALAIYMGYELTIKIYRLQMKAVTVPLPLYLVWVGILFFTLLMLLVSAGRLWNCIVGKYPKNEDK